VVQAVGVEFGAVDHVVSVGVDLSEEIFKVSLEGLPAESFSIFELAVQPSFELPSLQTVVSVDVVAEEDVFDERAAVYLHSKIIISNQWC
jgi:hypothetical protein